MKEIICNVKKLRDKLRGNKNCTLMISRSCEIDINKMPYEVNNHDKIWEELN